jgi:parallel beta-helix repeat protein
MTLHNTKPCALRLALVGAGLCALLGGCARPGVSQTPLAPTAAAEAAAASTAAMRCPNRPAEPADTGAPPPPDSGGDKADESSDGPSSDTNREPMKPIGYNAGSNTITLGKGAPTTLPEVDRALGRPELLRELAPGEWLLAANLLIGKGVTFQIAGPEVRRLKLRSDPAGFVWIKARGGQLAFVDTCVTSWDARTNSVDQSFEDGRSFVLARDGARMDIRGSELSYLGYFANESYGVAWRQPGTTGSAVDSRFGHNFYGLYSYEASDLVIRGNEVHHSVRYGIDPHTRSNRLLIQANISHHNGKQGIILAEECGESVVQGNTVYANALHGIVIYQRSNGNVVQGNISYGNALQGININDSSSNTIQGNTVYDNGDAGIGIGQNALDNLLVGNTARDNRTDGVSFYSDAVHNTMRDNVVSGNARYGIYVKSVGNTIADGNHVFGNAVGIFLNVTPPPIVSLTTNRVYDNREDNLRLGGG